MPMKPSTTSPGWKCRGRELLGAVLFLEGGEVGVVLGQSHAAAALGLLFFAAHVDVPLQLVEADVLADASSSLLPNSTLPMAAKYCALSGVLIRSSGGTPSGSGVPRSSQILGMLAFQQSRMPLM
jgi:hypothetical protein